MATIVAAGGAASGVTADSVRAQNVKTKLSLASPPRQLCNRDLLTEAAERTTRESCGARRRQKRDGRQGRQTPAPRGGQAPRSAAPHPRRARRGGAGQRNSPGRPRLPAGLLRPAAAAPLRPPPPLTAQRYVSNGEGKGEVEPRVPAGFARGNCRAGSVGLFGQLRSRREVRGFTATAGSPRRRRSRVPNTGCGPADGSGIYIPGATLFLTGEEECSSSHSSGMLFLLHPVMLPQQTALPPTTTTTPLFFFFFFVHP